MDNKQIETQKVDSKVQEPVKFIPQRKEARMFFPGVGDKDMFYYDFQDGSIFGWFDYASDEFETYAVGEYENTLLATVQPKENGPYQMINVFGDLSDQKFSNLGHLQAFTMSGKQFTFNGKEISPKLRFRNGKAYFLFPDGTRTKEFEKAFESEKEGRFLAVVQNIPYGAYRVLNGRGELSTEIFDYKPKAYHRIAKNDLTFSKSALEMQEEKGGKQMEKKETECQIIQDENGYRYQLPNGKETEKFFWGTQFSDYQGVFFALVQKDKSSKFQAMNIEGELSNETFDNMFVMHQHIDDGGTFTYGKGAEKSEKTDKYLEIYSMSKPGPDFASMQRVGNYFKYVASIYELTPEEVLENLEKIQAFEEYNYQIALTQCDYGQEMEELYQNYLAVTEYIKQTAYEAKVKLENDRKVQAKRAEFAEKQLF